MKQEIDQINEYFKGVNTVVVEAAHIYADKIPGEEQRISASIASELSGGMAARVRKVLLIDNLNVLSNTLDVDDYLSQLREWGYVPDDVFMEKELVPSVAAPGGLIDRIQERGVKIKNGPGLTKRFWIPKTSDGPDKMIGLIQSNGVPTCPALDALFSERKAALGQACVTILPISYAHQQRETRIVNEKAGIVIPTVNVFFDQSGGRTLSFN